MMTDAMQLSLCCEYRIRIQSLTYRLLRVKFRYRQPGDIRSNNTNIALSTAGVNIVSKHFLDGVRRC